jgi:riboflavin kinase/FMN adenylyltransferase
LRCHEIREKFGAKVHENLLATQPTFARVKVHSSAWGFSADRPTVLTIGTFDGVHAGHRAVLALLRRRSAERGAESVLLTFDPHPRTVLHPGDHGLALIHTPQEKVEVLAETGLDHLVVHPFTPELARLSPRAYVRDLIAEGIRPEAIIVGYDHRFGRNREGSFATLSALGAEWGFAVEELPAQYVEETRVSSTKVREALRQGDVAAAAHWLQRPYPLSGRVVAGAGLGRTWGFPTANVVPDHPLKLVPAVGVYAAWARVQDGAGNRSEWRPAMVNIGFRPTVEGPLDPDALPHIEAHLLEGGDDFYGQTLHLHFVDRLRNEMRFADVSTLRDALAADRAHTLQRLRGVVPGEGLRRPAPASPHP